MALQQAVAIDAKNVADVFVNDMVCYFFTFSQDYQVVATLELFNFFLVGGWFRDRQVVSFDLGKKLLEVLVNIEVAFHFGFLANEEFNWDWRRLVIIARESDWNVDSEHIS